MSCPKCGNEYVCPCDACTSRLPDLVPWKRLNMAEDGNNWDEACSKCGFTQSVHDWFDEEWRQYKALEEVAR